MDKEKKNGEPCSEEPGAENDDRTGLNALANAGTAGISVLVSILIGTFLGVYLDGKFGTKPYLTLIFLVAGVMAGVKNAYYFIKKSGVLDDD